MLTKPFFYQQSKKRDHIVIHISSSVHTLLQHLESRSIQRHIAFLLSPFHCASILLKEANNNTELFVEVFIFFSLVLMK